MLVPKYKIVVFLDNTKFSLIEIKYNTNNIQSGGEANHWLLYDKDNDMLLPLEILSVEENKPKLCIRFEDSKLELSKDNATYTDNKSELVLDNMDCTKPVYRKLKEALDDYILLLSFKH